MQMKYAGAVLEICLRKVMFYPNVQTFIDDKLIEFPEVDMQYRFGAPPKLIMKDEKGNHKESIRYSTPKLILFNCSHWFYPRHIWQDRGLGGSEARLVISLFADLWALCSMLRQGHGSAIKVETGWI